jgi:hypothetical protein
MSSPEIPPVPPSDKEGEGAVESTEETIPEATTLPSADSEELQKQAMEEELAAFERDKIAREEVLARLKGNGDEQSDDIVDAEFSDIEQPSGENDSEISLPVPYEPPVTRVTDEELVQQTQDETQEPSPRARRARSTAPIEVEEQEQPAPATEPEAERAEEPRNEAENPEAQQGQEAPAAENPEPHENHEEEHEHVDDHHDAEHVPHEDGHEHAHNAHGNHDEHHAHGGHGHGKKLKPWQKKSLDAAGVAVATIASIFGIGEIFIMSFLKNLWVEGSKLAKEIFAKLPGSGGKSGGNSASHSTPARATNAAHH